MSGLKLYTFDQLDCGEVIRLILLQGGKKFNDVRIKREEWPKLKDQTPWGALPVLEVDGKKLAGTIAIAEYLGDNLGMAAGGTAWDRAQLNSICDAVLEATIFLSHYWSEKDPSLKAQKKAEVLKNSVPCQLAKINKRIEENGSPDGFICSNRLTYADFFVRFLFCDVLTHVYALEEQRKEAEKYPAVSKLCKTVHNLPNIKKYLDSRPDTGVHWDP